MLFIMLEDKRGYNPLEAFIQDVDYVKEEGRIRILCGNLLQYNYPEFTEAVEWARTHRRTKIEVLAGPIVLEDSPLLDLKERQVLNELLFMPEFGFSPYFHLVQTEQGDRSYYARPGPFIFNKDIRPLDGIKRYDRSLFLNDVDRTNESHMIFEAICERLINSQQALLPLITTPEGFKYLYTVAKSGDVVFECLGRADLLKLPGADELLRSYK